MYSVAAFGQAAPAPSPPLPPTGLGSTAFLDAEGGPGTLFQWNSNVYVANRVNDGAGNRAPIDFRNYAQVGILHVAHTTKFTFLGAYVGGEVLLPVANVNVGPGSVGGSSAGVGDAIFGAYM